MRWKKNIVMFYLLILLPLVLTVLQINPVKAKPTKVSVDYYGSPNVFDTSLAPGKQFSINITVDYVEELWGYQVQMEFNPEVLQGVDYENGGFLGSGGGNVIEAPGMGFDNVNGNLSLFSAFLMPKENFPTGGGTLAKITFDVIGIGGSPLKFGWNTGLSNKTGGWKLGPDWEYLNRLYYTNVTVSPFIDGYFDNRPPVYITPGLIKGRPLNENFTVSVDVSDMKDLYAYSFDMYWNNSVLHAVEVVEGGFLKGQPEGTEFSSTISDIEGILHVESTTKGAYPGVDDSGTLANVTFLVKSSGSTTIGLNNTVLLDSVLNPLDIRTADCLYLKVHDIAITSVTVSPQTVKAESGEPVYINVTLSNVGGYNETNIDVRVVYGDNITIGIQTVVFLEMGANETLTFTWNTTGVKRGKYVLKAVATDVAYEAITTDNTFTLRDLYTIYWNDIAITSVSAPVSNAFRGHNVTVIVNVANLGTELVTFDVTAYCNETVIATETLTDFGYEASISLRFIWDTTGIKLGNYTLSANATVEDENSDNNYYVASGKVRVLQFEEEFASELLLIPVIPAVFVVAIVLYYWRRRVSSKAEEEF